MLSYFPLSVYPSVTVVSAIEGGIKMGTVCLALPELRKTTEKFLMKLTLSIKLFRVTIH